MFYGEEDTLFIWNTITFLFIDGLSSNYVLAAIVTYLCNQVSEQQFDQHSTDLSLFTRSSSSFGIHSAVEIYREKQ